MYVGANEDYDMVTVRKYLNINSNFISELKHVPMRYSEQANCRVNIQYESDEGKVDLKLSDVICFNSVVKTLEQLSIFVGKDNYSLHY